MFNTCNPLPEERRRVFWTTQLSVNMDASECNQFCGRTGLTIIDPDLKDPLESNLNPGKPATILNTNWVRGLALNILGTNGRKLDTACGHKPGSIGGHWSESYAGTGASIGNLVYTIPPQAKVSDLVKLVQEYANLALQKLVSYNVARQVLVEAAYVGNNEIKLSVDIYGLSGEHANVGITGSMIQNSWMWQ